MQRPKPPDIVVDLVKDSTDQYLVIALSVGLDYFLEMIPNEEELDECLITEDARLALQTRGLISPQRRRRYVLENLQIHGQPVPDLPVRVVRRLPHQLMVQGMLGFDFFKPYQEVRYEWSGGAYGRYILIGP